MSVGGSGGAALSAVIALVAVIARLVWSLDRAERLRAARARQAGRQPPAPVVPRRTAAPVQRRPLAPQQTRFGALPRPPRPVPEDARGVEVSQRLFVAAARMAVLSRAVSAAMLQRRLGTDAEATERLLLALEGTGIVGPLRDGEHVVLVAPGRLDEVFARHGVVEDAVPPGFE
jgi:hypothetical protein